jgi:NAD-specific glutamate dehydrogenase
MKNKDIPEFGSKGTVLLNEDYQTSLKISFQKYISGLMDLLVVC